MACRAGVVSWPQPTRQADQRFCEIEGWAQVRDVRGRTGTHHVTYDLILSGGRILRTWISNPVSRIPYGPGIWAHILRDQLEVNESEFWACANEEKKPDRGVPDVPPEALPADLVFLLINRVGLEESTIAMMTKEDAIA